MFGGEPLVTKFITIPPPLQELSESQLERKKNISRVTTQVLQFLNAEFVDDGFEWLLPVILSRSTDPLWPDPDASLEKRIEVDIYGNIVRPTTSMIVHKMVAASLVCPKLFALSPNIRIERRERATTGKHVYEFTQWDFEIRKANSKDIMNFTEKVIVGLISNLKQKRALELKELGRYDCLKIPNSPFSVYDREDLEDKYGPEWELCLTSEIDEPAWVTNLPREFYDFEDFETGKWDNYDLLLPNFGEVLSGSRREWAYNKLITKMERDGVLKENYSVLLDLSKEGRIQPSAGAGIGMERLISWLAGASHIAETQPFPRVPNVVYEL